ncbi:ligase-associated DNA damage response endonuclease PdeM [Acidisoma cellulosilytica]|uniref:Ligase-associated DNA damage response endonuclease PdeM n=1 Tax=Acidisoma cellulosilyticum TaxID=2802395 RepID=A0A963YYA5_9PROT|nr:ligase-associated DNA damage response endonuclease PdeM [Acidisoma cellulosilyticum]MCB8879463.1 ligase-associated DNA damage response endonuclease PdeM [Acidisoma cellulosilyticum]
MSAAAPLHIGTERLMLDPSGAVSWPSRSMLILSDLHLEKGSAAAARGRLLPPYDTRSTLDNMSLLIRHYSPKYVLCLGDSFHDAGGAERLAPADQARLAAMARQTKFIWVLGNHDPSLPAFLPGDICVEWSDGPFRFRHEAGPTTAGAFELSGHYHPKATVPVRGAAVTRPCFITDGHKRLILPAFGAYTGGLDVADPAIAGLFPRGARIFLLGQGRLFHFPIGRARAGASAGAAA